MKKTVHFSRDNDPRKTITIHTPDGWDDKPDTTRPRSAGRSSGSSTPPERRNTTPADLRRQPRPNADFREVDITRSLRSTPAKAMCGPWRLAHTGQESSLDIFLGLTKRTLIDLFLSIDNAPAEREFRSNLPDLHRQPIPDLDDALKVAGVTLPQREREFIDIIRAFAGGRDALQRQKYSLFCNQPLNSPRSKESKSDVLPSPDEQVLRNKKSMFGRRVKFIRRVEEKMLDVLNAVQQAVQSTWVNNGSQGFASDMFVGVLHKIIGFIVYVHSVIFECNNSKGVIATFPDLLKMWADSMVHFSHRQPRRLKPEERGCVSHRLTDVLETMMMSPQDEVSRFYGTTVKDFENTFAICEATPFLIQIISHFHSTSIALSHMVRTKVSITKPIRAIFDHEDECLSRLEGSTFSFSGPSRSPSRSVSYGTADDLTGRHDATRENDPEERADAMRNTYDKQRRRNREKMLDVFDDLGRAFNAGMQPDLEVLIGSLNTHVVSVMYQIIQAETNALLQCRGISSATRAVQLEADTLERMLSS